MKIAHELSTLNAVSPLDGRYASRCDDLRAYLSEAGFMAHRVEVEVNWLIALSEAGLPDEMIDIMVESYENNLLEAPSFTKPENYQNLSVIKEYLKGNHIKILDLKKNLSICKTKYFRPGLITNKKFK